MGDAGLSGQHRLRLVLSYSLRKFIVYAAAAVNIMLLQCLQTPLITCSRRRLLVVKGFTNQQTLHPGSVIPGYRVENQHETYYFLRNIFRWKKYQIPPNGYYIYN